MEQQTTPVFRETCLLTEAGVLVRVLGDAGASETTAGAETTDCHRNTAAERRAARRWGRRQGMALKTSG
jgi:hypothetical protein